MYRVLMAFSLINAVLGTKSGFHVNDLCLNEDHSHTFLPWASILGHSKT